MSTKIQRQEIRDVLSRLNSKGKLTPDAVIAEAKNPNSPLHDQFTWDVKAAALQTWRHEARQLITSFRVDVIIHQKKYNVKEFVNAPGKLHHEQGYVSLLRLRGSGDLAREVYQRELSLASLHAQKCKDFAAVLGVTDRVDAVLEEIEELLDMSRIEETVKQQQVAV